MQRHHVLAAIARLIPRTVIVAWSLCAPVASGAGGDFRPDEMVCRLEPGYSIDSINGLYGTYVKGFVAQTSCYLLGTQAGQDAESLAVAIGAQEGVQYCGANYYLDAPEPFQRSQPFLDVQGTGDYEDQWSAITLALDTVGAIAEGSGVSVAIIDGGVNVFHPALTAQPGGLYSGWDYVDEDSLAADEPGGAGSGHGTFVAGVTRLVAPGCNIYAYRVLDTLGRGDGYSVTRALLQALDDGCRVVNLSLGMLGRHDGLDDALRYAESQNVTVVVSAGNDATEIDLVFPFPGKREYCLTVAALDSLNVKADFSNYGYKIDICAPGTQIYSPFLDTSYAWWDGTSFAAPFLTGLAALLYSLDSLLTWAEVDSLIRATATNVDSLNPGLEGKLGAGLVNMAAALEGVGVLSCGDADGSGIVTAADLIHVVNYVFRGGAPPYPLQAGDLDCSGVCDAADLIHLVRYVFLSGPAPCDACP